MTSDERRAARRRRRDERRAANRSKRIAACTMDAVADIDRLYDAAMVASRGVAWKTSTQRYMIDVLPNVCRSHDDLMADRDIKRGFTKFDIWERGKLRHISAVRFSERVCQKSLSVNALVPAIVPTLTAGCSANIRGRGTDYAIRRLKSQLVDHYRRYGTDGWVLLVDFEDYFASIDHDVAKDLVGRSLDDERVIALACDLIDAQDDRGLGLGSEPNQILAVAIPLPIDHALEAFPGIEATGRYMDDTYCISPDKDVLWRALGEVCRMCKSLGLSINWRKTRIVKLSRGFAFLKKRFSYGENGKVVVRPCHDSVVRERRKLKKHATMVSRGEMTREQARQSYQSWRGLMGGLDARRTLAAMDELYSKLFGKDCDV